MVYPRKKKAAATQRESFVDTTVLDDLRAEAADILARSEEAGSVSDEDQERFETIESEVEHITAALATQDQLRSLVDAGAVEAGSIQSATARPAATVRDQAMRQIERGVEADELPAHAAEKIETMIARDGDLTAKWAITAGSPAYRTAFAKLVGDSARGHLLWTAEEQNAYREVDQAARAMQIDTGTGSYAGRFRGRPVRSENAEPWAQHSNVSPSTKPSESEMSPCVQVSPMACTSPLESLTTAIATPSITTRLAASCSSSLSEHTRVALTQQPPVRVRR